LSIVKVHLVPFAPETILTTSSAQIVSFLTRQIRRVGIGTVMFSIILHDIPIPLGIEPVVMERR
jgi:hypothetical protein